MIYQSGKLNVIDLAIELRERAIQARVDSRCANYRHEEAEEMFNDRVAKVYHESWVSANARFEEIIELEAAIFGAENAESLRESAIEDGDARFEVWKSELLVK